MKGWQCSLHYLHFEVAHGAIKFSQFSQTQTQHLCQPWLHYILYYIMLDYIM